MRKRSRERSTTRDPFSAFREIGARLTVYDDIFAGTPWNSPNASSFDIDWRGLLSNAEPPVDMLIPGIKAFLQVTDLPVASTLVGYTASIFDFMAQVAAAPTMTEIQVKLGLLLGALKRLGSIAQGGNGSGPMNPRPDWFAREDVDEGRRQTETWIREKNSRTPALHPMLQDHISMAYASGIDGLKEVERDAALSELAERQDDLVRFFDKVPQLINTVELAEHQCRHLAESVKFGAPRPIGAPQDKPRNWALVRLMWIYRDVFQRDLTIYLRKIRGPRGLEVPEPDGCMAFVVAALQDFNPVQVHELESSGTEAVCVAEQGPFDALSPGALLI